jgi:signal transduction histidine kinase
MATSSGSNRNEKGVTRVLYGVETVVNTVLQFLKQTDIGIDACVDQTRPLLAIDIATLKEAFLDAKKRGVKLRYITEITKDNISYCKQLLTMVHELKHLDGVSSNLYLSETGYLAPAAYHEKGKPAAHIIYSNVKEVVEHQRYVFDTLWNKGIPAEQRFEQLEEGVVEQEFLQVISNQNKISRILTQIVKSIKKEGLFFLPNDIEMIRLDRLGAVNEIIAAAQRNEATIIRIICPVSERNSKIVNRINRLAPSISILNADNNWLFGLYIIDGEKMLRTEIKEMNTSNFSEAIDFAIYSNRKLTVKSFRSVFALLWNERTLNEQLKVHDKAQKEFINIAAHELRTPAQSILGYAELVKEKPHDIEKQLPSFIEAIHRNAVRLHKLTKDILDVTRIESQNLNLNRMNLNLIDILVKCVEDVKAKLVQHYGDNKRVQFRTISSVKNDGIFVSADRERITQVISNLLDNAIKFTSDGTVTVSVEQNKKERIVVVSVQDTGLGIDQEIFPKLFTKFSSKSFSGTGLGWYISKSIVEAHGGRIWAKNNNNELRNRGATFYFSLPTAN